MSDLKREVTMELDEGDVCDILTDALCRYGPLDGLRVTMVSKDNDGITFSVTFEPRETEAQ